MSVTVKSVMSGNNLEVNDQDRDVQFIARRPSDGENVAVIVSKDGLREGLSTELDWTIFNDADLPSVRPTLGWDRTYDVGGTHINTEYIDTPEKMLEVAARWIALARYHAKQEKIDPAQLLTLSALIEDARPLLGKSSAEVASHLLKTRKITVNTDDKEN